jgi:hypothetical protein
MNRVLVETIADALRGHPVVTENSFLYVFYIPRISISRTFSIMHRPSAHIATAALRMFTGCTKSDATMSFPSLNLFIPHTLHLLQPFD